MTSNRTTDSQPARNSAELRALEEKVIRQLSAKEPNRTDVIIKLGDVVKQFRGRIETTIQILIYAYIAVVWTIILEDDFKVNILELIILIMGALYQLMDIFCSFVVYLRLKNLPGDRDSNECMNIDIIEKYNKVSHTADMFLILKILFTAMTSTFFIVFVLRSVTICK